MGGPLPPGVTGYRSRDGGPWEPVYEGERRTAGQRAASAAKRDPGPVVPEPFPPGLTREELFPQLPGIWRVQPVGGVWFSAGGERLGRSLSGVHTQLWLAYQRGQLGKWLADHDRGTTVEQAKANAEAEGTRDPAVVEHERNREAIQEWRESGGGSSGGVAAGGGSPLLLVALGVGAFFILGGR